MRRPSPDTTASSSDGRHRCPTCNRTFSRVTDLERHAKKHDPGMRVYHCDVVGCEYQGNYRKDKRDAHVRMCHAATSGGRV